MNIDKTIEQWEEKHFFLLEEYSKGNANKEVMQMYRSQMKNVLDFINELKLIKANLELADAILKYDNTLQAAHECLDGEVTDGVTTKAEKIMFV